MALTASYHVQCDGCGADDRPGRYVETLDQAKAALIERCRRPASD